MADTILTSETDTLNPFEALAERVEAGERCDQHDLLKDAFIALRGPIQSNPRPGIVAHNRHWFRFKRMLDAEAYESAAMTLIPEGDRDISFERSSRGGRDFKLWQVRIALETVAEDPEETGPIALGEADTLALSLTAASLRAHASSAP